MACRRGERREEGDFPRADVRRSCALGGEESGNIPLTVAGQRILSASMQRGFPMVGGVEWHTFTWRLICSHCPPGSRLSLPCNLVPAFL